jgi:phage tail sheath protein FI
MTVHGADGDEFMVVAAIEMAGGRDGIAGLVDADYQNQAWDVSLSPFNQIFGKNMGLVKFACPGITATAVQKTAVAYAEAKNHQFRYEIPSNKVTEIDADTYINDTIGRNDFAVVSFPSYGYVADPETPNEGKLKLITLTGAIHGREARIAVDYDGYHKAEAGLDATLPNVLKLTTEDAILDEEYLNPLGIAVIKKMKGNFVMWGDRTLHLDPTWKWKHQREMMCYYENVLRESFDWIVFKINDALTEKPAMTSLMSFFLPEWRKRALRGKNFVEACKIKIDSEINTDATRAAGDLYAEISLRLADTVERFIMKIGKQGIFESVSA